jgi:hypothetical protein
VSMHTSRVIVLFFSLLAISAAVAAGTAIAFSQAGTPISQSPGAPATPAENAPPGTVKTGSKEKPPAAKARAWTGLVTDSTCGAKHTMIPGATDAECTRGCVAKGAKYALEVGRTLYTLDGGPQDKLNQLAGSRAKVTGNLNGDTIQVVSVIGASRKPPRTK